jgi:hypothetical protein
MSQLLWVIKIEIMSQEQLAILVYQRRLRARMKRATLAAAAAAAGEGIPYHQI